jgi:hypothetical protein
LLQASGLVAFAFGFAPNEPLNRTLVENIGMYDLPHAKRFQQLLKAVIGILHIAVGHYFCRRSQPFEQAFEYHLELVERPNGLIEQRSFFADVNDDEMLYRWRTLPDKIDSPVPLAIGLNA